MEPKQPKKNPAEGYSDYFELEKKRSKEKGLENPFESKKSSSLVVSIIDEGNYAKNTALIGI